MTKNKYKSLASRYHLRALIFARTYWQLCSNYGTQPVGIRTKMQVMVFKNKMELHNHIHRVKQNIKRMMNETN